MELALYYVTIAMGISIVLNLLLKRLGISQIIGYIFTGVVVTYAFDLRHLTDSYTLEMIGEFGIVFLMFTVGLEMSLSRLYMMKVDVFLNGFLQVLFSTILFFAVSYYWLHLSLNTSIIMSMALSLSSTAVVLSYLKSSKEIYRPYGQKATGILIFQDIAVIPMLILIGFLASNDQEIGTVLLQTGISAIMILGILFIVGKRVMTWLLHFSSSSEVDEFFMGSVLVIVVGASLLAHAFGFTYSLGAFVAGMIIAETRYLHKVETDIAPFKDLLLGTFFVTVGMKIDILFFIQHLGEVLAILAGVMLIKAIIIFGVISLTSKPKIGFKAAVALSQVGEFSFAIFALATNYHLVDENMAQLLVLVIVLSLMITPLLLRQLGFISARVFKGPSLTEDFSTLPEKSNHIIVCGYGITGRYVARTLKSEGVDYIVVDNSYKHVQDALKSHEKAYFADMSKISILDQVHVKSAASVIVTLDNLEKKKGICEAILSYAPYVKVVVKVLSAEEKRELKGLPISVTIDGKREIADRLVSEALRCELANSH